MHKLSSRSFPAKLLLFGEYSILFNSKAIVLPLREYSGELYTGDTLNASQSGSHRELWWLYSYCLDENIKELDLGQMKKDLQNGMWFESSISQGTGVGSSGAIVAAVFWQYANDDIAREVFVNKNFTLAREILAKIECHFHEESSGVDPLTSLLDRPLLVDKSRIEQIDISSSLLDISVVDTNVKRQIKKVVSRFLEKCEHSDFLQKMKHDYLTITNQCVDAYLSNDIDELKRSIKELSSFQLKNFQEFIPSNMIDQWRHALGGDSGFLKLCGAGGGGHLLKLNC